MTALRTNVGQNLTPFLNYLKFTDIGNFGMLSTFQCMLKMKNKPPTAAINLSVMVHESSNFHYRFTIRNFRTQLTVEPDENLVLPFLLISGPGRTV